MSNPERSRADRRLMEAYADYAERQVKAGILTCRRWEEAMLADTSIEDFMRNELAAAGIEVPE